MNHNIFYKSKRAMAAWIIALAFVLPGTAAYATIQPTMDGNTVSTVVSPQPDPGTSVSQPGTGEQTSNDPQNPDSNGTSESVPPDTESQPASESVPEITSQLSSTPESKKETPSSSSKPVRPSVSVDTNKDEIDRAASHAAEAVSDPDVLSSQSWDELLTSEAVSDNESEGLFNNNQELDNQKKGQSGGIPWLLIGGILLIVAGLVGIGYFIYSQFFSDEDLAALKKGSAPAVPAKKAGDTQPIQTFTDISSDSSGAPNKEDYVPPKEAVYEEMKIKKDTKNQRPLPQSIQKSTAKKKGAQKGPKVPQAKPPVDPEAETQVLPKIKPQENPAENLSPKAQAKPVEQKKPANFDWEKFFDESDKKE